MSGGYVDLTIDTMRAFGVEVAKRDSAEGTGAFLRHSGEARATRAADFVVEGDWSGAAFLLVAGAVAARDEPLEVSGLSPNSSQPDRAV